MHANPQHSTGSHNHLASVAIDVEHPSSYRYLVHLTVEHHSIQWVCSWV
ncbi:Uncharacterised protein [Vibrio cholerae]|nr:Uncharacterised protein [Vibrio cholerae]CSI34059.1 Uncharacterised protein [Vibrio cholerae]